jgi:hypothetical protein
MIKFFKDFFYKLKYKNSDLWCNIAEINDTDMKIIIYRLPATNHLGIVIWDKVPASENEYKFRDSYFSSGDPKYAYMIGFTRNIKCEDIDLDELIESNE